MDAETRERLNDYRLLAALERFNQSSEAVQDDECPPFEAGRDEDQKLVTRMVRFARNFGRGEVSTEALQLEFSAIVIRMKTISYFQGVGDGLRLAQDTLREGA